jgi:5-methylcytosine-specific restriction endonuclease McrBC GTP-binding regulatory subunit McrB
MNTSDQNVFTLDTAFKRRWSFEQISNNIEKDTDHKYKGYFVPGTDVTWEKFLTVINKEILKHKITSEDKRMGKYFVSKDCLTDTVCDIVDVQVEAQKFAYKVLEYIWNDVCKISKDDWFDTSELLTLEDLIDAFVNPKVDEDPLAVFKTISFK